MSKNALPLSQQTTRDLLKQGKKLIDDCARQGRDLTYDESREADAIIGIVEARNDQSEAEAVGFKPETAGLDPIKPAAAMDTRDIDPREVRTLDKGDSMADWVRQRGLVKAEDERLSFGRFLRGIVTNDWSGAEGEYRAMAEGAGATGGFTVPTPLSAQLIDKARNASRVFQAGATTVPMDSHTLKMARVAGDPTVAWKVENEAIDDSDAVLEQVLFTARTLVGLVKVSRELVEDSLNIGDALTNAFSAALALELDRAALRGSGTPPEPRGVLNTSGVSVTSLPADVGHGGEPYFYDVIDYALGPIQDANHEPNAVIFAPRTNRWIAKQVDSNDNPRGVPAMLSNLQWLATNQIPVNITEGGETNTSEIYTADWSQLMVGLRHSVSVELLRERYAENFQYAFLAHLRADVQVAHPEAFSVLTGVKDLS